MDNESLNEEEMLGSADNFETAYESHSQAIYKFLFWRTKDVQLSEDLTSSTFEKAWTSRQNFHGGSEKAWLYRIARNVLIDYWRKKKELFVEDTDDLQDDVQPTIEELLVRKQRLQDLQRALDKLPNDMHDVITLRFIEGQTCRQVASRLKLSEGNVRVKQYRALKRMKEYLR